MRRRCIWRSTSVPGPIKSALPGTLPRFHFHAGSGRWDTLATTGGLLGVFEKDEYEPAEGNSCQAMRSCSIPTGWWKLPAATS